MTELKLKRNILAKAKLHNVQLAPSGLEYIMERVTGHGEEMDVILKSVPGNGKVLQREDFAKASTTVSSDEGNSLVTLEKPFGDEKDTSGILSIIRGSAKNRTDYTSKRYQFLYDLCVKNEKFSSRNKLSQIETLIGSSGARCILGLLQNRGEDKIFLEDPTGSVRIKFTESSRSGTGLFCEGSYAIVQGEMDENKCLLVQAIVSPPIDDFAHLTYNDAGKIILISDLCLDQSNVLENFKKILDGYSGDVPEVFVLMGSFTSKPFKMEMLSSYVAGFAQLGAMIRGFKEYRHTRFIMIPGPNDPGFGKILPFPPIPTFVTKTISEKFPFFEFSANPCRLIWRGSLLLFYRKEMIRKIRRLCVIEPDNDVDLYKHYITTILSNRHICPIPLLNQPIVWSRDSHLVLDQIPRLIVLSDRCEMFNYDHKSLSTPDSRCQCINPGSFMFDSSFVELEPGFLKAEFKSLGE